MTWTDEDPGLAALDDASRARLSALVPMTAPAGTVLFRPGDAVKGYVLCLEGRVDVCLTGPTGREILLYQVAPGQSCIQSTLGLLGGEDYSAEARTVAPSRLVLIPRAVFRDLLNRSEPFRTLVFSAFAVRMQNMMHVLEKIAFLTTEMRLAEALLARADESGKVNATQAELATIVGTAREVISRRLVAMARRGAVHLERGVVTITDRAALQEMAADLTL
ncbi:MAG: Crp/Fnr family transcriptional regulator [Marinibacterium sp.]